MNYYSKYLKYKNKYINLQNQLGGNPTCTNVGCSYLKRRINGVSRPEDEIHFQRFDHFKVICPHVNSGCDFLKRQNQGNPLPNDKSHFDIFYHNETDDKIITGLEPLSTQPSVITVHPIYQQNPSSIQQPVSNLTQQQYPNLTQQQYPNLTQQPVSNLTQQTVSNLTQQTVSNLTQPVSDISILTYNILSQNLADAMERDSVKDGQKVYDLSYMNDNYRWSKISSFISSTINKSTSKYLIICLQEVCESWLSRLRDLFGLYNYNIIYSQDGHAFTGKMGVLIAFPNTLGLLNSESYKVCQEQLETPAIKSNMFQIKKNNNTAILLLFRDRSSNFNFGVVTYQMPRIEPNPDIISLHLAQTLSNKIISFMDKNSWVYAGDFNILQDSPAYDFLKSVFKCIWRDFVKGYPLTNNAVIKQKEFSGCIDYMFYSENLDCVSVIFKEALSIMPNSDEPSDHSSIIAKFSIRR